MLLNRRELNTKDAAQPAAHRFVHLPLPCSVLVLRRRARPASSRDAPLRSAARRPSPQSPTRARPAVRRPFRPSSTGIGSLAWKHSDNVGGDADARGRSGRGGDDGGGACASAWLSLASERRRDAECKHRERGRKKGRLCCS